MSTSSRTMVLIHDLWLAPRIWNGFRDRYAARGFRVLTPAWPRMEGTVNEQRCRAAGLAGLGLAEVAAHYAALVEKLGEAPVLMGHGVGGLVVEMLLDRGLGAAGVALAPAAPRGVASRRLAALGALGRSGALRQVVRLRFDQFRRLFAPGLGWTEAREIYDREVVPAPLRPVVEVALAGLHPWTPAQVDFARPRRAPLLLVAGGEDDLAPPAEVRAAEARYRSSPAAIGYREFARRGHLLVAQAGWEEVADYALAWIRSKGVALPLTAQGKTAYTLP